MIRRPLPALPILAGLLVVLPLASARAADSFGNIVMSGSRVRVTVADPESISVTGNRGAEFHAGQRIVGTLAGPPGGLLRVRPDGGPREILLPRSAVGRLEASGGRHSYAGAGALTGAVVCGVTAAIAVSTAVDQESDPGNGLPNGAGMATIAGVGGALVGLGLGALVGSGIHREKWEPAPFWGLSIGAGPEELRVGLAIPLGRPAVRKR